MARKGERKNKKVYSTRKAMRVIRNKPKLVTKASAGAHPISESMPLTIVLRDLMRIAKTAREAKIILNEGRVKVDGRKAKDPRMPIGFMDVISFPSISKHYRMLYNKKGQLTLNEMDKPGFKLCRIQNKTITKEGIQLNLHDSRNIIVKKDEYKTGGTIKLAIPEQKIKDYYPMTTGNIAYITGGQHAGEVAVIQKSIEGTQNRKPLLVMKGKNKEFQTIREYAFILGTKEPTIKLKEEDTP